MIAIHMLSEPVIQPDIYATGIADIEAMADGNVRFIFFTKQRCLMGGDEYIVVGRIIMPSNAVRSGIVTTARSLGFSFRDALVDERLH